jgi:hypothetical protein
VIVRRFCLFAAVVLMPTPALAGDDAELWLRASATADLSERWQLGLESILRFSAEADGLYEGEFGGTLGYELQSGLTLAAGYLRVPTYSRSGVVRKENRFRQQLSFAVAAMGKSKLSGRLRIEERLIGTGGDMGVRLRPGIGLSIPLRSGASIALVASHESFVNLNSTDWGQDAGYDRMRNFLGVSAPVSKRLTIEGGYLNQFSFRKGAQDIQDHVASASMSYRF